MVKTNRGFSILELIVTLGIVGILASIATALYFNYITVTQSSTVLSEISAIEEKLQVAIETDSDGLIQCDDTLINVSELASDDYLEFSVSSLPLDPADPAAGNAPSLVISSRVDKHGGEGIELARTLHEELSNATNRVENATVTDSVVTFAVRLSNSPACATTVASGQPPAPAPAPAPATPTAPSCKSTEMVNSIDGSCMKACNAGFHFDYNAHKCALGDCPAGQTLDGSGYCIAATPPPATPAPSPAPPAAPLCKSNEKVDSRDGSCMKVCNAGFHFDDGAGKCAWGDCPAGQTLDGSGYCIASAPPPPPPPPPPAPDPAANLAGTTTVPAAKSAGPAPDPNPAPAPRQTSFDPTKALGENNRNPCPDGQALAPGQSLDPLPPADQIQCQQVSKNMTNPYQETKCQVCSGSPVICEHLHREETCTWPNNVCINELTNHEV